MRSGRLRHRVSIQHNTPTTDAYGGQVSDWSDFAANVAASIEPLNGRELLAAQAVQSETSHRVTVRYLPGVTASMRITFEGRIFEILNVLNIGERGKELQLLCSEGPTQG